MRGRRATERGDIQPSSHTPEGPLLSFLGAITPGAHDALLISPNSYAGRVKVQVVEAIQIIVRIIRVQQRDMRDVGHGHAEGPRASASSRCWLSSWRRI